MLLFNPIFKYNNSNKKNNCIDIKYFEKKNKIFHNNFNNTTEYLFQHIFIIIFVHAMNMSSCKLI